MAKKKRDNKAEDRSALETSQTAEVGWIGSQFQEHPVLGLTPQRLHQLLTAAEQGDLAVQADLFADMEERDGHIFSEMDKRKRGVGVFPWGVKPPKNATPLEKRITEEVREWIDDIEGLEEVQFSALDAIGHAYSGQAINWHQLGKLWLPRSFEHELARNFMTPLNSPNELRLRDGSMEGAELWDYGWFIHKHKAKSGYIARAGLHRVLSWPFLFKNYGVRDVLEFLEIHGIPLRIGKYPAGATHEEKATLMRAVISLGRNAGGIIPKGMEIDFESAAAGDTDNHMGFMKWCEQTQSKVIVGGTLLSQADGKTSTNAQGAIHENGLHVINKSDANQYARSFNNTVVSYMLRLNYPNLPPDRYPTYFINTTDTEDIKVFSEALPKLVETGMKIPLQWAHEKLGIPMPEDDDEPILQPAQQQVSTPLVAANSQLLPAALSQAPLMPDSKPYDQVILDEFINDKSAKSQSITESWTQQILSAIQSGTDDTELLELLSDMHPNADEPALQDMLAKLIWSADMFARLAEQAEHE